MSLPDLCLKRPRGRPRIDKSVPSKHHPGAQIALADTVNEFCAKMKCSRVTAYSMMRDGDLKYVQIGKQRRIPHSEYRRLGVIP
jgi:excisionase family DNA binding protein